MSELRIGDEVQTGAGTKVINYYIQLESVLQTNIIAFTIFDLTSVSPTGKNKHSEVVAFLEKLPNVINQFLSITTFDNETLILTGNHQLYAKKRFDDQFHPV